MASLSLQKQSQFNTFLTINQYTIIIKSLYFNAIDATIECAIDCK